MVQFCVRLQSSLDSQAAWQLTKFGRKLRVVQSHATGFDKEGRPNSLRDMVRFTFSGVGASGTGLRQAELETSNVHQEILCP